MAALAGCRESSATPKAQAVQQGAAVDTAAPLATIGADKVTLADVRERVGDRLDQLEANYRRQRDKTIEATLDSIIHERLVVSEVKKTGKTSDDLLAAEASGSFDPSDVEVSTWYNDNKARLGGRTLEQLKPQIVDYLRKQRRTEAANKLEQRLRTEQHVTVAFQPYRLQFNDAGAPTLGKSEAPVTLVEFSDFQCPFCKAALPILKQVEKAYPDKVRIVYHQYPIASLHPYAFKAAEASLCANEQGKFWQLHDAMFDDQNKLTVSDLKATAAKLGVDQKKFDSCLDSGKYVEQIQNDQREGARVGVTGTPTMFINGVMVDGGAVPFETLSALIDKELARGKN